MKHSKPTIVLGLFLILAGLLVFPQALKAQDGKVMWINHLDFLPGDPTVVTSFNAYTKPPGIEPTSASGLYITSTTSGGIGEGGGIKVIEKGVQVPPWYLVTGVRLCYELTSAGSYISQITLMQLQSPGAVSPELLDTTARQSTDAVCVDSAAPPPPIDPSYPLNYGALRLSLGLQFSNTTDAIVIRGVGLYLVPDPNNPMQKEIEALWEAFENHTHIYLTGKGVGHNNTEAITSEPVDPSLPPPPPPPPPTKPPKPCKNKNKCN